MLAENKEILDRVMILIKRQREIQDECLSITKQIVKLVDGAGTTSPAVQVSNTTPHRDDSTGAYKI